MTTTFKKAVRQSVKLKIAITGPSGSGKTWGALDLARGLAGDLGRVAVVDTENESAALYADRFDFDQLVMRQPFTVAKFAEAIDAAMADGYQVLVLDSITHEWAGDGGILDQKTQIDLRTSKDSKNKFANWAQPSADHSRFIAKIVQAPIHIIATMRSKTEYDLSSGKPVKLGMAPVQRDGTEYEFSCVFDLAMNHEAAASKDRTSLFDTRHFPLSSAIGQELRAWLAKGSLAPAVVGGAPPPRIDPPPSVAGDLRTSAGVFGTGVTGNSLAKVGLNPFSTDKEFSPEDEPTSEAEAERRFSMVLWPKGKKFAGQFVSVTPLADLERYDVELENRIREMHENMPQRPALIELHQAVRYYRARKGIEPSGT